MADEYISVNDTAKLVRKELATHFPKVQFSVRGKKYSGGSSIHVDWVDGPTNKAVEAVVGEYHGAEFDGMQDLKYKNKRPYANDWLFCQRSISDPWEKAEMQRIVKVYDLNPTLLETPDAWNEALGKASGGNWISLRNAAWQFLKDKDLTGKKPEVKPVEDIIKKVRIEPPPKSQGERKLSPLQKSRWEPKPRSSRAGTIRRK